MSPWFLLPLGAIIIVESGSQLTLLGGVKFISTILVLVIIRELAPLLTAFIVIGRSGTAIATEIGNMIVAHELEAIRATGNNPVYFIVTPRIIEDVKKASADLPKVMEHVQKDTGDAPAIAENVKDITKDVKVITGNVKKAAPEIPGLLTTTHESLEEAEKLIQGLKNHWLLSGSMPQVRGETPLEISQRESPYEKKKGVSQ